MTGCSMTLWRSWKGPSKGLISLGMSLARRAIMSLRLWAWLSWLRCWVSAMAEIMELAYCRLKTISALG
jgi:hypothetical protein